MNSAAAPTVSRVEPPNWWPGHSLNPVRLLLSGTHLGGARVAPVDTGSGTVLAAVFGTVTNGETSCFFLPTVGIVDVPATAG